MAYVKLWDPIRVREVMSTESRQKSRDLFLHTHSPFQRIRLDFCKEPGSYNPFITEADVRAIIFAATLNAPNRLFFVVGEAGSGKSELCQWLEYMADTTSHIPIHIPRSMTRALHVANLLRNRLGVVSPDLHVQQAPPKTRARHAALTALMLLYERGNDVLQPAAKWEPFLMSEALAEHLAQALIQVEDVSDRTATLLDADRLTRLCSQLRIKILKSQVPIIGEALNSLLLQALDQALWLSDLRLLLGELSDRAIAFGMRPLLLIEDITAFQAGGDLLLDYLLDLTSGHFDAVIGVTTGFERDQLARATLDGDLTHIHQRLRARFVLTDEDGHAYSLENNVVEFALAYLRSVKSHAASPTIDGGVDAYSIESPIKDDLYPFTEVALQRAYSCLREEGNRRQTPRLFIEHVLAAALLSDDIPPNTLDRSPYLEKPPIMFRQVEAIDEQLQSLLRWYGTVEDDAVTVNSYVAEAWGIPMPSEMLTDGRVRVPRSYRGTLPSKAISPDVKWQQELRDLQEWLDHGGLYPTRETLKRGVERVMLQLGDPRSLASRESLALAQAEIYYTRGDELLPIHVEDGSGDVLGDATAIKVCITRDPAERGILEELFYYALSGAALNETCENVALTLAWAQDHWDAYHIQIRSLLATQLNGITAEQLIFITWRCLCALEGTSWKAQPYVPRDAVPQSYSATTPWDATAHDHCFRAGELLYAWLEVARRLFIGTFMYRDTLLDFRRFSATASSIDIDVVLHHLAHLPVARLRTIPFKIQPANVSLYDLLVPLQRYAAALLELDTKRGLQADLHDASQRARHLGHQLHTDMAVLRSQVRSLQSWCGQVGVSWRSEWDDAIATIDSLSVDELENLYVQVRSVVDDMSERLHEGACDIWEYQEIRHRLRPIHHHRYWSAEAILGTIVDDLELAAQDRLRSRGRTFVDTRPYRELLAALRGLHEEVSHARPAAR